MKHIVCFSGGHSSALVAEAVVRRYGAANVVLLNHNINPSKEHADVKRFKLEVSVAVGVPITYANWSHEQDENKIADQFDVSVTAGAFKNPGTGDALCTHRLKTKPFNDFLSEHYPPGTATIYYGFDDDEQHRIARRRMILDAKGYATCFPLAEWPDTLESTEQLGITPPLTYATYSHANCAGCLKGGMQHWYVTYCHRPDVYEKAEGTEARLGYSILSDARGGTKKPLFLKDLRDVFARMKCAGVPTTEHYPQAKFNRYLRLYRLPVVELFAPCECAA